VKTSDITVVIPSRNEGDNLRRTVESVNSTLPATGEILVVDGGSTDGSCDFIGGNGRVRLERRCGEGLAQERNWGAMQARGDVVIFADAHVDVAGDWWRPFIELLQDPTIGAVAPAVSVRDKPHLVGFGQTLSGPDLDINWLDRVRDEPYPIPLVPGCFIGMRRQTFIEVGGFDTGMVRWGSEDNELSLRLWLLGYELMLVPQVDVPHLFREQHPYLVKWKEVIHNRLRLAFIHFGVERVARVTEALRGHSAFSAAFALSVDSDYAARRASIRDRRVRSDDWFFERFGQAW
jgi:GT2 family glycosyltransferase